jgi:hypothetical protein
VLLLPGSLADWLAGLTQTRDCLGMCRRVPKYVPVVAVNIGGCCPYLRLEVHARLTFACAELAGWLVLSVRSLICLLAERHGGAFMCGMFILDPYLSHMRTPAYPLVAEMSAKSGCSLSKGHPCNAVKSGPPVSPRCRAGRPHPLPT